MSEAHDVLRQLSADVKRTFDEDRTILSYGEWLELVLESPAKNLRGASQYIRDVFDHYGTEELELPRGPVTRFSLFDAPWADGDGRVAGQEQVQQEIYRLVTNFVRDGRVSRLVMLHGPNGSAKSSLIHCVQAAMEHYSHTSEGALYSYAWIFPSEKVDKGTLGFGATQSDRVDTTTSYAQLGPEEIDARLPCELRDHPIFLLPKPERKKLLARLAEEKRLPEEFLASQYILEGDLSPRDRAIYDALLMANDGDHAEVLKHVQVERFYVSRSYARGVSTVEPQMHVDADARQLTADRSIANLPRALQSVPMFELAGPLVSANRGMLEFSDLLKRPVEAFKYLLSTSEEASASLPQFKIVLDEVLIASSNEKQLGAFKEYPDWNSFKGRIELVRVPYLRRFSDELRIYERQINTATIARPLAPHVVEVAAMWAVLTRLKRPNPESYAGELAGVVKRLTPVEKLRLYDDGLVPSWCSASEGRELRRAIGALDDEYKNEADYEGQVGASAREIRTLILNAAHRPGHSCLSPLPIFEELRELVSDTSLYDFLKQKPEDGYAEPAKFIDVVHGWWLDILDDEMRTSMGLVEETKYDELFARYILHVSHYVKKEKLLDKITGKYVDADTEMMADVETLILAEGEGREEFRRSVIGRIGAWSLENTGRTPNYRELFRPYIEKMEADYFTKQKRVIEKNLRAMLDLLVDPEAKRLDEETRNVAKQAIEVLESRFGYEKECTSECTAYLLKERYAGDD